MPSRPSPTPIPDPVVLWFRRDLRIADHPALRAAAAIGRPVLPVYVHSDPPADECGAASRWWLHHSLSRLSRALEDLGSRLLVLRGDPLAVLRRLTAQTRAGTVFWNRRHDPAGAAQDAALEKVLAAQGVAVEVHASDLLHDPASLRNKAGGPFQVFTPFYNRLLTDGDPPSPGAAPRRLAAPVAWPASVPIEALALLPRPDWAGGLRETWTPGEEGARRCLEAFDDTRATAYAHKRDLPGEPGTSRLSPHLHFGEITARQIWHTVSRRHEEQRASGSVAPYQRQLAWREFAHHLLVHFPHTPSRPLRADFERFPWDSHPGALRAWQRGRTGYPVVDAGLRELWHTGWMHNRVRMIAASFLVKHLLLPWTEGARWFMDTLVDADLANNTLGWQWVAGCGADAAPYFRIFNPVLQSRKFDPAGAYLRRWVPELARLPDDALHAPWECPPLLLAEAGVRLGKTYPHPVVEHGFARDRALTALSVMKERAR